MATSPRPQPAPQSDEPAGTMSFLEHLEELRTRLIRSMAALAAGMAMAVAFVDHIAAFVLAPVRRALGPGRTLLAASLTESFAFLLWRRRTVACCAIVTGWLGGGIGCAADPAATRFPAGEIVDLSHTYDERTIFWPTSDRFVLEKVSDGITEGGYYYAANKFSTAEHGGTHIDSPIHFAEGRVTVDRIPLERLIGQAYVIDVREAAARDRDYQVSVEDFTRAETQHGRIPDNAIVLLRTGFSERWPDAERYLGTAQRGAEAVADLHFPGLHPDAATWLIENRSVAAVGIDTASIDYGPSTLFETHRRLAARDIPAFENLTNLDRLPETGATVIALPMKIGGGSGAPLRAVAVLP